MFGVFFASKLAYKVFIDCHHLFLYTQVTRYTMQSVRARNVMARKVPHQHSITESHCKYEPCNLQCTLGIQTDVLMHIWKVMAVT